MSQRFVLDANILSPILRARKDNPAYIRFQSELSRSSVFYLSPVAYCEILVGLYHKDPGELMQRFTILRQSLIYVELEQQDWEFAGKMRGLLMQRGITVNLPDASIAAQANRLNATVVTDNFNHFKNTSNSLENWLRS